MSAATVSFAVWVFLMLAAVAGLMITARRGRKSSDALEESAAEVLPMIGQIAEKQHLRSFGRPATEAPGPEESWYPEAKKKFAKHA